VPISHLRDREQLKATEQNRWSAKTSSYLSDQVHAEWDTET